MTEPTGGLPLTADERKLLNDRIEALEKREHVSKADIEKIVTEILEARSKPKPEEDDAETDTEEEW